MDEDDDIEAAMASIPIPEDGGASAGASSNSGSKEETSSTEALLPSKGSSSSSLLVNPRQRGNPVLKHIRNVPWEYADIVPDYLISSSTCALFLSVRYYNLHPDYIHERLKELKGSYMLRVLLVLIDVPDPYPILKTLTHIAMLADLTIIPCHTTEDAGKILDTYKMYETKPPEEIQERQDTSILQQVMDALTSIRSVNKTDAITMLSVFRNVESLMNASVQTIACCPGIGPQKALRIHKALHEPCVGYY